MGKKSVSKSKKQAKALNSKKIDRKKPDSKKIDNEKVDGERTNSKKVATIAAVIVVILGMCLYKFDVFERISNERQFLNTGKVITDIGQYTGEVYLGQFNGEGTFVFNDNNVLKGIFEKNIFTDGVQTASTDSGTYVVTYEDAEPVQAEIKFSSGATYSGEMSEYGPDGNGIMTFPSGDTYDGEFSCGQRNGTGTFTFSNGDSYVGSWVNDEMFGEGEYHFADNTVCKGDFVDNKINNGSYEVSNDGNKYTVTYTDGLVSKVVIDMENGSNYIGTFNSKGSFSGQAYVKFTNGDSYNGKISNDKISGEGTYIWRSGDSYTGTWSNNTFNGNGTYTWSNGAKYVGDWSNGQMSGEGVYYYPPGYSGQKLSGEFVNGKPNGSCTYYTSAGKSYRTDWNNGVCQKVYE